MESLAELETTTHLSMPISMSMSAGVNAKQVRISLENDTLLPMIAFSFINGAEASGGFEWPAEMLRLLPHL